MFFPNSQLLPFRRSLNLGDGLGHLLVQRFRQHEAEKSGHDRADAEDDDRDGGVRRSLQVKASNFGAQKICLNVKSPKDAKEGMELFLAV